MSVQQVIDCAVSEYDGCNGGLFEWSNSYLKTTGITTGFAYPYNSGQSGIYSGECKASSTNQFKISSYRMITGNCTDLRQTLQTQPIATAI